MAMKECHQRWIEIESLCGFPLVISPTNADLIFPVPVKSGTLPRVDSSCSFYRSQDIVGTPPTASVTSSSSTSGSGPINSINDQSSPHGFICSHESSMPTTARWNFAHLQKRVCDGSNSSKPTECKTIKDEQPQRSVSSCSLSKFQQIRNVCNESQKQSFNLSMFTATDTDTTTSIASTSDKLIASSYSFPATTTAAIDCFSSFPHDPKLLRRNVSEVSPSCASSNDSGLAEDKRQKSAGALMLSNNKKLKFSNLLRKVTKF